jgi:hypothetical protein
MYALRSWDQYTSFVRRVFIVSNCLPPQWIDLRNERIEWIYHEAILPKSALPTFNSHAIEACLHKIPGLSENFIYSNDDFFLTRPATAADFFHPNRIAKVRLEPYGQVNGEPEEGHPDYLNGARNANRLIEQAFSKSTTQLMTHSPMPLRKDVLAEMEDRFSDDFHRTIHNRFRAIDDIAVASYMHANYSILSGKALPDSTPVWLVQPNHNFRDKMTSLIKWKRKNSRKLPLSACLNDGTESHVNDDWNAAVSSFLEIFFDQKSEFEV